MITGIFFTSLFSQGCARTKVVCLPMTPNFHSSPIKFMYLINSFAKEIAENREHDTHLLPNIPPKSNFLFADDVALLGDTPVGL